MIIGYWEVIQSEDGIKFACQRTPIFGDQEFETTGWIDSLRDAELWCDQLNDDVEEELASIPDYIS